MRFFRTSLLSSSDASPSDDATAIDNKPPPRSPPPTAPAAAVLGTCTLTPLPPGRTLATGPDRAFAPTAFGNDCFSRSFGSDSTLRPCGPTVVPNARGGRSGGINYGMSAGARRGEEGGSHLYSRFGVFHGTHSHPAPLSLCTRNEHGIVQPRIIAFDVVLEFITVALHDLEFMPTAPTCHNIPASLQVLKFDEELQLVRELPRKRRASEPCYYRPTTRKRSDRSFFTSHLPKVHALGRAPVENVRPRAPPTPPCPPPKLHARPHRKHKCCLSQPFVRRCLLPNVRAM